MNQNEITSTVHAPSGRFASIAIISFSRNVRARFYLTRGQCTTLRQAL